MESWRKRSESKGKRDSCQKNASGKHLTGWKFRCEPLSCRQSTRGEHLNSSDSVSRAQIKAHPPSVCCLHSHHCWTCKHPHLLLYVVSGILFLYRQEFELFESEEFSCTTLWDRFPGSWWRLGGRVWFIVADMFLCTDRLLSWLMVSSRAAAVASNYPRVSMEMIFISWNWYPLSSLPAFLCTSDLIKYTRWIWADLVIRSWSCILRLFLHCKRLLIGRELWK